MDEGRIKVSECSLTAEDLDNFVLHAIAVAQDVVNARQDRRKQVGSAYSEDEDWLVPTIKQDTNQFFEDLPVGYAQLLAALADVGRGKIQGRNYADLVAEAKQRYPMQGMAVARLKIDKDRLAQELLGGRSLIRTD